MAKKETAAAEHHQWVRLTGSCNNNCTFCLDKDNQDGSAVPLRVVYKQLADGIRDGATRLILSGGEATLHPRFFDIVRRGKSLGYRRVQVVTNGRMFAYHDFLRAAAQAGLDEITFSMHGHTPALHDAQTRIPGSFSQSLTALKNALRDGRFIVNVDIVINKSNYRVIDKIMDFFIGLGVHEFDLLHVTPFGDAWKNRETVFYEPREAMKYLNKAFAYSRRDDLFVWTNRFPASYLTAYPELIQNPLKISDEVRGRRELFDNYLENDTPLPCRGARCRFCFLQGFCDYLERTKKAVDSKKASALLVQAGGFKTAKLFFGPALKTIRFHANSIDELELNERAIPENVRLEFQLADFSGFDKFVNNLRNKNMSAYADSFTSLDVASQTPRVKLFLEINISTAAAIKESKKKLIDDGVSLFYCNRMTLGECAGHDVPYRKFFNGAAMKSFKIINAPMCAAGVNTSIPTWKLDVGSLDGSGNIDVKQLTESFVLNAYYVFPAECDACSMKKRCSGVHVNHLRAFGFKPKPIKL